MKIWLKVLLYAFVYVAVISLIDGKQNETCQNDKFKWMIEGRKSTLLFRVYAEEWWSANCQVKDLDVNATLWQKINGAQMFADGKNLIMENNVFNFTNPSGFGSNSLYDCNVCGRTKLVGGFQIETRGKAFQYPRIIKKPNNTVELGADIKLKCEISRFGYSLIWQKNGSKVECSTRSFNGDTKSCTITIRNFDSHNEGVYTCLAKRGAVNWIAQDEVRLVMRAFEKPTFVNPPNRVISLKEGEIFNLPLKAIGYPKPEVNCTQENKKQNDIITNGSSAIFYISISKPLTYSIDNDTRFYCTAWNRNGSITLNFLLNIWVKPKINIDKPEKNDTISMTTAPSKLVCKVDEANPKPIVEWKYSDDNRKTWLPLTPDLGFAEIKGSTLHLHKQTTYKMFYKCVANNSLGKDTFTWTVLDENSIDLVVKHNYNITRIIYSDNKQTTSYLTVIIVISCVVAVLVLCFLVIMYRRKKALGGFYICTLPPYKDYIKILDQSKFIHEQTHKLPYMSEWEFPRQNVELLWSEKRYISGLELSPLKPSNCILQFLASFGWIFKLFG